MTTTELWGRRRDLLDAGELQKALRARDLSGNALARLANTSAQTISQLRQGKRVAVRAAVAVRIEKTLNRAVGTLFGPEYDAARTAKLADAPKCPTCGTDRAAMAS